MKSARVTRGYVLTTTEEANMHSKTRQSSAGNALLVMAAVLALAGLAAAQEPVARITELTGVVTMRHADKWLPVSKTPVELVNGDKVNTDKGRVNILFLGDESTVVLDVGTNITINQPQRFGASGFLRRVEIYAGDLWFRMTKGATQHTALVTPTAVGGLRGTEGAVHVENGTDSSFTLKEGELEITSVEPDGTPTPNAPPVRLHGGETLSAHRGEPFTPRRATETPKQPDLKIAADKLPEPKPGRLDHLKDSDKPAPEAVTEAEHLVNTGGKGGKTPKTPKPATPKTPKTPRHK